MPMYNVLFVESGTSGGGSFESLYQHLCIINRQRFRPVVVYLNENRFVEPVGELGIPVYVLTDWLYSKHTPCHIGLLLRQVGFRIEKHLPACRLGFARLVHIPLVRALERIVRKEKVDILHLNDHVTRDLFGLFVAERTEVACISHLRSRPSANLDRRRLAYANRVVSAYIANSKMTRRRWEEAGVDISKSWLVYNGIPSLDIKPLDIRQTWNIDDRVNTIIGCVANLNAAKGHTFLLQTFAQFFKSRPNAILLLVGHGPLKSKLIRFALELGIQDSVLFAGYQTRAKEIVAGLDLLVVPSKSETFGRVLLEAMQVGTPVVATNSGGIPEVVTHEYNGLLVNYGDEEALSQAMERVLTDRQLRSKLVENGYRTVRERFSIERYASGIERIYESVLRR